MTFVLIVSPQIPNEPALAKDVSHLLAVAPRAILVDIVLQVTVAKSATVNLPDGSWKAISISFILLSSPHIIPNLVTLISSIPPILSLGTRFVGIPNELIIFPTTIGSEVLTSNGMSTFIFSPAFLIIMTGIDTKAPIESVPSNDALILFDALPANFGK